jgi:hypothetical protein
LETKEGDMSQNADIIFIEVACASCGRIQRVRARKIIHCDGYTCSYGRCKKNPDFKIPKARENDICVITPNAAGSFNGWTIRPATVEERRSIERAKAILDEGMLQLLRRN